MNSIYIAYNNWVNHKTALSAGCGASEFQISLLAKALADDGHDVTCFNSTKTKEKIENIFYRPYQDLMNNKDINGDIPLIFWRFFDVIPHLVKFYNPRKIILWSHDYGGHGSLSSFQIVNESKIKIVAVSNFHKNSLDSINPENIIIIPNALYDNVYQYSKDIEINKNMITFGSAWHKGLNQIVDLFDKLYLKYPNFFLNVLSPNYGKINIDLKKPYIKLLNIVGNKKQYCNILQSSLCTISTEFPETFGCVFAESYYLKTPVIATNKYNGMHEFINNEHTCDLQNYDEFENLLLRFYDNRPIVQLDSSFLGGEIINIWKKNIPFQ